MFYALDATIDEEGAVRLDKPLRLPSPRRARVTILDPFDMPDTHSEELAPEITVTQMAKQQRERRQLLFRHYGNHESFDLPFVDDGADW